METHEAVPAQEAVTDNEIITWGLVGPSLDPIDVAHAALLDVGRPDLAEWIHGWEDEEGFYLEYDDDILDEADWALIDKAETLARMSVGLPARVRGVLA